MVTSNLSPTIAPFTCVMAYRAITMALLLTTAGCGGCWKTKAKEDHKTIKQDKENEKRQPDFSVEPLQIKPRDETFVLNSIKPGHWLSATQQITANHFDFRGEIHSHPVDAQGNAISLDSSPYTLTGVRSAILPQGQTREIETLYYIPLAAPDKSWLHSQLKTARGGALKSSGQEPTTRLHQHQFFFVVLAQTPDNYTYLKNLDSIRPPNDEMLGDGSNLYYHVLLPRAARHVPLPSCSQAWTTIAYMLWDDYDPTRLNPDQQQAMLDWLHWGGQLIISGPGTLDRLRSSFLDPYLPVVSRKTVKLTQTDFDAFNSQQWSITGNQGPELPALTIAPEISPEGIELDLRSQGQFIPLTGQLVSEGYVGRGRIVVTAFPLNHQQVTHQWENFDNFFNGCLLRRPGRRFQKSEFGGAVVQWTANHNRTDPRLLSYLRFFSRDTYRYRNKANRDFQRSKSKNSEVSNVAGWNDDSAASAAARTTLETAAGITVPETSFVVKILVAYLVILVPLNWLFFRFIGRIEWAWIAAPIIAIVGAATVIRLAQLDIGFVRSRTEVAVLEIQPGYDRGHLTRYSALYSSLATRYRMIFEDRSAVALPFSPHRSSSVMPDQQRSTVTFRRDQNVELSGFRVESNSTSMFHSEAMLNLEGALQLRPIPATTNSDEVESDRLNTTSMEYGRKLLNGTNLMLRDVGVVHHRQDQLLAAWIGDLAPHEEIEITLRPVSTARLKEWNDSPVLTNRARESAEIFTRYDKNEDRLLNTSELKDKPDLLKTLALVDDDNDRMFSSYELKRSMQMVNSGELSLAAMVDVAIGQTLNWQDTTRLIGWTDQELGGMTVEPEASQKTLHTLIVADLERPGAPRPELDFNLKTSVITLNDNTLEHETTENDRTD